MCKTFYTLLDKEGTDRTIFTAMNAVLNLLLEEGERVKCSPFTKSIPTPQDLKTEPQEYSVFSSLPLTFPDDGNRVSRLPDKGGKVFNGVLRSSNESTPTPTPIVDLEPTSQGSKLEKATPVGPIETTSSTTDVKMERKISKGPVSLLLQSVGKCYVGPGCMH